MAFNFLVYKIFWLNIFWLKFWIYICSTYNPNSMKRRILTQYPGNIIAVIPNFAEPSSDGFERFSRSEVKNHDHSVSSMIKSENSFSPIILKSLLITLRIFNLRSSYSSEPLLASCVPKLEGHVGILPLNFFDLEINADCIRIRL